MHRRCKWRPEVRRGWRSAALPPNMKTLDRFAPCAGPTLDGIRAKAAYGMRVLHEICGSGRGGLVVSAVCWFATHGRVVGT
ncbi:hypothetical protein DF3PB_550005 [uncultured Defluviicoccus sp.]|uniref:Uncharacterized protein n=1 Tax=metagenome TaxID=256318 RepID=A0A380TJX3_9ZZZZ|nr:hypothetical protein DF3PB_550005 [uncultured Defluviicoccus sp.]